MDDIHTYTDRNRRAWDKIAEVRQAAMWPDAGFFARGGSILDPRVLDAAGDVRGKTLLHLQCATGEEALSWVVAGAEATGVDISAAEIALAEQKAADAALSCRFVAADIYALPLDLQNASFDYVYTGSGALTWLPDVDRWAAIVAAAVKPHGRLILFEGHPLAPLLTRVDGSIIVDGDYFSRSRPYYGTGWRHFKGGEEATETNVQFSWPLGDVVTGLARAGLCVERLEEFPSREQWQYGGQPDLMERLPGEYLLVARRPI